MKYLNDEQARNARDRGLPGDDPAWWYRPELAAYLESRGFAVYEHETEDALREAVLEDLKVG